MTYFAIQLSRIAVFALCLSAGSPTFGQAEKGPVTQAPTPLVSASEPTPVLEPPVYGKPKGSDFLLVTAAPAPIRRADFNLGAPTKPNFRSVPGGVVFGLAAKFSTPEQSEEWLQSQILQTDAGWVLRASTGRELRIPVEQASLVSAALDFTQTKDVGDWLVDIDHEGSIHLAYPLKNTLAGMIAARADLAPQFCMPIFAGGKSLIVDREIRLRTFQGSLRFEADLEVRFFRPGLTPGGEEQADQVGQVVLTCAVNPATNAARLSSNGGAKEVRMASYLHRLSDLAGWIGFFRWAKASNVGGLDEFLRIAKAEAKRVPTPSRIDRAETATWISGGPVRTPAKVPEWMQEHRRRQLEEKH